MSTKYIPNTSVEAEIMDPTPITGYANLYLEAGENGNGLYVGSINAGTSNIGSVFAVGLGGINGAFYSLLHKHTGQDTDRYKTIHNDIYQNAGMALSGFQDNFGPNDPVIFSMMLKPPVSYGMSHVDGVVFVDVFNPNQLPHGNSLNYAMVYVVPPLASNYNNQQDFLAHVEKTNLVIVSAINLYNSKYAFQGNPRGLEPIKDIYMCLFSGGYYRGSATVDQVAMHNLRGLESAFSSAPTEITKVYFENSYDKNVLPNQNVFRALKDMLADSPS